MDGPDDIWEVQTAVQVIGSTVVRVHHQAAGHHGAASNSSALCSMPSRSTAEPGPYRPALARIAPSLKIFHVLRTAQHPCRCRSTAKRRQGGVICAAVSSAAPAGRARPPITIDSHCQGRGPGYDLRPLCSAGNCVSGQIKSPAALPERR